MTAGWLQMAGGGRGANRSVFAEAAMSWERRQAALRDRAAALAQEEGGLERGWWWGSGLARHTPAVGSAMRQSARQAAGSGASDTGGGSVSDVGGSLGHGNAASMAAAARRWRGYQRSNKRSRLAGLLLGTAPHSASSSSGGTLSTIDAGGSTGDCS